MPAVVSVSIERERAYLSADITIGFSVDKNDIARGVYTHRLPSFHKHTKHQAQ